MFMIMFIISLSLERVFENEIATRSHEARKPKNYKVLLLGSNSYTTHVTHDRSAAL